MQNKKTNKKSPREIDKKNYKDNKNIVPVFLTNTITPNEAQHGNNVPSPPPENAEFSKKCVDENHK